MSIFPNKPCLLTAVVALLTASSAHADNEEVIAECARIASTGDRILCLENALRGLTDQSVIATATKPDENIELESAPAESDSDAVPAIEEVLADSHEPAIASASVKEKSDANTVGTSISASAPEALPDGVIETVDPEPVAGDTTIDKFGATEKQPIDEEPDAIEVRVVEVSKDPYGKLIFTTEGGQVWYQTDKRSVRYREVPFDADIRKAAAGSFLLRKQSGGVSIRVKRRK